MMCVLLVLRAFFFFVFIFWLHIQCMIIMLPNWSTRTPCLDQGGSFSNQIRASNKETDDGTGTAQA